MKHNENTVNHINDQVTKDSNNESVNDDICPLGEVATFNGLILGITQLADSGARKNIQKRQNQKTEVYY